MSAPVRVRQNEFEDLGGCFDIGGVLEIEAQVDSGACCRAVGEGLDGVDELDDIGGILGGEVCALEDELEGRRARLRVWSPKGIDGVLMGGSDGVTGSLVVPLAFGEWTDGGLQEGEDLGELVGGGPARVR